MTATRPDALKKSNTADVLMKMAADITGLHDFGGQTFVAPLERLLASIAEDVSFNENGRAEFEREIIRFLINRLRFQDDLKKNPEILDEDVSDPIIILGLPRSGTTKAQRMIGADSSLLTMKMWQAMNPAPFPGAGPGGLDSRIMAANLGDTLAKGNPAVQAGHRFTPGNIDGDAEMVNFTLNDWFNSNRTPSPSWSAWVMSRSEPSDQSNFDFVRALYQYLQWQQGGRGRRRWLIKNVGYIGFLPQVLSTFPGATLVHIHRHPATCLPSLAKLMQAMWGQRLECVDPVFVGEYLFQWEKTVMERYLRDREDLNLDGRILDVQYDQIRSDPMPAVREIYRRAGHPLTLEAERAMSRWEQENEQGKFGEHKYSLEEFGLSEERIAAAFAPYIDRFIRR